MKPKVDLTLIRKPAYLSPSALKMYRADVEKYFSTYLAIERPPRFPQTKPMAVGSGFDAYVKADLSHRYGAAKPYDFDTLYNDQVEVGMRDLVRADSLHCWESYKNSGALHGLYRLLDRSSSVSFETRLDGVISHGNSSVTLCGIPDMLFTIDDLDVIFDWKVNGYYSKASPKAGYAHLYPDGIHHKDCYLLDHYGIKCNAAWFNDLYDEWAMQLTTYSWLGGLPVGNRQLCMLHQLAWDSRSGSVRVAEHSGLINPAYQLALYEEYVALWQSLQDNTLLPASQVERLNREAQTMMGSSIEDTTYREMCRGQ